MFLAKLNDIFTIALTAFSYDIAWYPGMDTNTKENAEDAAVLNGSFINSYYLIYFISIGGSVLYTYLASVA